MCARARARARGGGGGNACVCCVQEGVVHRVFVLTFGNSLFICNGQFTGGFQPVHCDLCNAYRHLLILSAEPENQGFKFNQGIQMDASFLLTVEVFLLTVRLFCLRWGNRK